MTERSTISPDNLREYTRAVFAAAGLGAEDAAAVAESLVMADLRGVESHGTTRIPIYVDRIRRKMVDPRPQIDVERPASGVAIVDGGNGPGVVVGNVAMREAISLAKANGVGVAVARNSNHYGICSYYAAQALEAGCIGLSVSNAPHSMAVWGSREAALGTNPIGVAVPSAETPAFMLDMATSVVARGKIVEKGKRDETIPLGWALDREGNPTTSAKAGVDGVVLPFGGPKGSGLAILVDILAGVLSGANYGRGVNNLYKDYENPQGVGHFFLALDLSAFMPAGDFERRMDAFTRELKGAAPAPGFSEVLMPGEIERGLEQDRQANGILLPENVVADIARTGAELGVDFSAICGRDALPAS